MSDAKTTPVSPARPAVDLSEESDYDLLEMMNWKKSDPDVAREAWAELHRRHIRYLYFVCLRHTRGLAGGWAAEDLAEDTIKRVYEHAAATFEPSKSKDPEVIRLHVRAWLGQIAENLSRDAYRGRPLGEAHLEQEHWQDVADRAKAPDSKRVARLVRLMQQILTEREQHVLRVTFQYHDLEREHQHLPDDVLQDLARQWGITSENVRQIKSRALKKLKAACTPDMDGPSSHGQEAL